MLRIDGNGGGEEGVWRVRGLTEGSIELSSRVEDMESVDIMQGISTIESRISALWLSLLREDCADCLRECQMELGNWKAPLTPIRESPDQLRSW